MDNPNPQNSGPQPPRWAQRFLRWYCDSDLMDEVQGDLLEMFQLRVNRFGARKAKFLYIKEVLQFFRPATINRSRFSFKYPTTMLSLFKNYLKVAWRNMLKSKAFSSINLAGLAIGLAACLLIFQYVHFESSYDQFHKNNPDIYRVQLDRTYPDRHDQSAGCTAFLGPALKEEIPEVRDFTKLWGTSHVNNVMVYENESHLEESLFYADASFFQIFSYPLVSGDPATALSAPYSIVLTESTAKKIFGNEPALGKSIRYSGSFGTDNYRVTGVVQDLPKNTHLKFNTLVSFQTLVQQTDGNAHNSDGWNAFLTYLLLEPGTDPDQLSAKLPAFVDQHYTRYFENGTKVALHLQPLPSIHLKSNIRFEPGVNGSNKIVRILLFTAIFILGIAWINYINLATAKAMERAKEVGVRKVVGAEKGDLRRQFMTEAVLLNLIGLVFAVAIALAALPLLNQLTGIQIPAFEFLRDPKTVLILSGIFILGVILSGFYPAFITASFSPTRVLSGEKGAVKGINFRKALVVFQFSVSIILIAGSFIVSRQVNYMMKKDIGMDIDRTLVLKGPGVIDSTYEQRLAGFKERMNQYGFVSHTTNSTAVPGKEIRWVNNSVRWARQPENNLVSLPFVGVDDDFFNTFELPLISGRVFDEQHQAESNKLVITRAATHLFGFETPEAAIDEEIIDNGDKFQIVGVVDDYHQESLSFDYRPIVFRYLENASSYYSIKFNTDQLEESLATVEQEWNASFPGNPFSYFFLDEFFDRQYRSDQLFGRLFGIFTALGIFVACIGLLGLSSHTVQKRTKEIGIRKVLGANTEQILVLISREHLGLILVAALVGTPLAYWIMTQWLGNYAFAIDLHWYYFLIPIGILFVIAMLTISFHALRAALANPVEAIN
ncbi:ABC transporter permease [Flavilitoribacter nigricans]|uniref:ABC transporter permease n=1 Tax=Flavilitoribacter nigricans (strain ATCC 23147 / DSM 23189 / NBRC 102662 / NCIMB 1420 / SS-2) TaxID=1122177 RepID=A0A2D0NCQ8_FLAN2|nr:ABC transporter permease [Flavilitoribacter nigricans]PHN06282.1 ABC transporter permease [Flavilitoribacter nigricans DSM 23189 = NBRC 102662]